MLYNKLTKTIKYICFLRILSHIFKILCFFYHGVPLLLSVLLAYLHKSTPYHLLTNVVIWNKHIPTIEYFPTPFQISRYIRHSISNSHLRIGEICMFATTGEIWIRMKERKVWIFAIGLVECLTLVAIKTNNRFQQR